MTPKDLQRLGVIFIPWCAGASRDERLVRKRRLGGSRGKKCRAGACPQPWVGRAVARSRRARVRKCPPELSLRRKPESRRGGIPQRRRLLPTKNPVRLSRKIFILLCGLRKAVVNPALGDPKPGGIHQAFTRLLPRETSLPCGVPRQGDENGAMRVRWSSMSPALSGIRRDGFQLQRNAIPCRRMTRLAEC